ncbi:hypothetical protein R75465_08166 [Paraburkholderia aspalathi]|nr:hypothetical protein R75465_08166 [Paraburkholderia aspalathi]
MREIDDGRQYLLRAAIWQRHRLVHQPHDVARERVHLRSRKRHARLQVELLRGAHAGGHQRAVFILIVRVALQVDAAGELCDLVAHQLFLIHAVAEAFFDRQGIQSQLTEHVVTRDELRIACQARIGHDQVRLAGRGMERIQATGRQGDVQRAGSACHRLRGIRRPDRHTGSNLIRAERAAGCACGRAGCGDVGIVEVRRVDLHRVVRDDRATGAADGDRLQHHGRFDHRADIARDVLVPRVGRDNVLRLVLV